MHEKRDNEAGAQRQKIWKANDLESAASLRVLRDSSIQMEMVDAGRRDLCPEALVAARAKPALGTAL
jgi:hypothetical protein